MYEDLVVEWSHARIEIICKDIHDVFLYVKNSLDHFKLGVSKVHCSGKICVNAILRMIFLHNQHSCGILETVTLKLSKQLHGEMRASDE